MALFRLWMTAAREAQALTPAAALTAVVQAPVVQAPVVQAPVAVVATTSSQLGTDFRA